MSSHSPKRVAVAGLAALAGLGLAPGVRGATPPTPPGMTDGPFVYQYPTGQPAAAGHAPPSQFAVITFGTTGLPPSPFPLDGSTPAWSPSGSRLAFARGSSGHRQIFLADADGSHVVGPITRDPGEARDPTWSPDGRTLAFTSTRDGPPQIFSITVQGTGERRLTNDPGGAFQPAWSPSTTTPEIAFASHRSGHYAIWLMDTNGGGERQVTSSPASETNPSWRADGTTLAFAAATGADSSIYTVRRDGSQRRRLTYGSRDTFPSWSPTGDAIAFTRRPAAAPSIFVLKMTFAGLADGVPSQVIPVGTHAHWGALPLPSNVSRIPPTMAAVQPEAGGSLVRLTAPASTRQVRLALAGARVPLGYVVHAPHGAMITANVLPTAAGGRPAGQGLAPVRALVSGTVELMPMTGSPGLTLRLVGPGPTGCSGVPVATGARRRAPRARPRRAGRMVMINHVHGPPVTLIAGHSVAASPGTIWDTEETCAGTLTTVRRGVVTVTDLGLGRTVQVTARHSYLALAVHP